LLGGALLAAAALVPYPHAEASSGTDADQARRYGVLDAKADYQATDDDAGVGFYEIDVSWASWEPTRGDDDEDYRQRIREQVGGYVDAGGVVAISVGLQDPPDWVSDLPDGTLRDQDGNVAPLAPNYAWSASVDRAAARYIKDVVDTLGSLVSQYRIGIGDAGETMYPDPKSDPATTWWIGVEFSDLPEGVDPNPMPGWEPGEATWNGDPVTSEDASRWYDWYLSGLKHSIVSQGKAFRDAGFDGELAFLAPGQGAHPWLLQERIDAKLADVDNDPYGTVNTGVAYQLTIPYFAENVSGPLMVNATGAADDSGVPDERLCRSGDEDVDTSPGSTAMRDWSSTRWTHALASRIGADFEVESPTVDTSLPDVYQEFQACRARYLQWLNDESLNTGAGDDGTLGIEQYADWIADHPLGSE
jgi:hypothetical protein